MLPGLSTSTTSCNTSSTHRYRTLFALHVCPPSMPQKNRYFKPGSYPQQTVDYKRAWVFHPHARQQPHAIERMEDGVINNTNEWRGLVLASHFHVDVVYAVLYFTFVVVLFDIYRVYRSFDGIVHGSDSSTDGNMAATATVIKVSLASFLFTTPQGLSSKCTPSEAKASQAFRQLDCNFLPLLLLSRAVCVDHTHIWCARRDYSASPQLRQEQFGGCSVFACTAQLVWAASYNTALFRPQRQVAAALCPAGCRYHGIRCYHFTAFAITPFSRYV